MTPHDELDPVSQSLGRIESKLDAHSEALAELRKAVEGEGDKPGLKGRVDRIESRMSLGCKIVSLVFGILGGLGLWLLDRLSETLRIVGK
jgi:hypothetical protein